MKIAYSWLKNWINTPVDPDTVTTTLTDIGLEVEGVETTHKVPGGLQGIVVGEVLTCEQHPNADRLKLTTVNIGGEEPLSIVCGAPNVAAGQKVLVATIGSMIHPLEGEPFKIKKGKIRGEVSMGMICAEDELSLGKSHDGIMVLPEDAIPGTVATEQLNLEPETCIEIGLTPNRTDAMSHYGVARDLHAAIQHLKLGDSSLKTPGAEVSIGNEAAPINVKVDKAEDCPVYLGCYLENAEVKESPDWLKEKLVSIGLTPKNNVVDITNFILHDLGQPLHAFDADQIQGDVRVGGLPEGTVFTTLDGVERKLSSEDLMICDDKGGLCIAGVFGGEKSGVTESTKNIFLESAWFHPVKVRKTAKRHGLNTDASFRFERGVDPETTMTALEAAVELLVELTGCKATKSIAIAKEENKLPEAAKIELKWSNIPRLTGIEMPRDVVKNILNSLDFKVLNETSEALTLEAPRYRADVTRPADVIEELLRIYGFNQVPIPRNIKASLSYEVRPNREKYKERLSQVLTSRGAMEMMSNSLTAVKYLELMPDPEKAKSTAVHMLNPLSTDLGMMRQTLLFQGLEAVARNTKHQNPNLFMYEFGKAYHQYESGTSEKEQLSIFRTGRAGDLNWNNSDDATSPELLKSQAYAIFDILGWSEDIKEKQSEHHFYGQMIQFQFRKKSIGTFGSVAPALLKEFKIDAPVWWCNLDWELMFSMVSAKHMKASELSKFPSVRRDLSLLIDQQVSFQELKNSAFQAERNLLKKVGLFDVYEGDKLEAGKKSYALNFILRDENKTLDDKTIEKSMDRITNALIKNHSAVLR
ncbi:MAG: phenylalanine--tRNA ligase subunit beta [Flavobacteriales bacterium]|nr:phenylalanine--tRNA ligase subunit beta [Flavobacteriales bacterium]